MKSKAIPNPNERPARMTLERQMQSAAADLYRAWTQDFDRWFAEPGELFMTPEIDKPFFFYNRHDWGRHAHYGRFLELAPPQAHRDDLAHRQRRHLWRRDGH